MEINKCKMLFVVAGLLVFNAAIAGARSPALILTPLLKANHIDLARNLSSVDPKYFLNITSNTGFFTVDEKYNSNIFFWYIPVELKGKQLNETPWIIWLQGGPGASSIAGLFDEIGPLMYTEGYLKRRPWSWSKKHSMLFIDNPVGAGFSFTNSNDGFIENMSTCATHLYKVLQQFITMYPEHRKAPLYIAGESYAGRYIPALAVKILEQDNELGPLDVNLQGIIMGNPVMNREIISDYSAFYQQWGLIDSQGVLAVKHEQDAYIKAIKDGDSAAAMDLRNKLLDHLSDMTMQQQNFNLLADNLEDRLKGFINYVNNPKITEAIHAGDIRFTFSNATVHKKLTPDFLSEVNSKMERLLEHYRVLIYCGQLDLTAPCVPNAQDRRKNWKWSQRDMFLKAPRVPWWYDKSVAGYVKSGGRFTEVLVRGAGHLVPMDKPAELLQLISYFIRGLDLPQPSNYQLQDDYTPDYIETAEAKVDNSSGTKVAMGISIFINVILVFAILAGVVLVLRWRRRTEMFMYNNVEETSITEGVLTMS